MVLRRWFVVVSLLLGLPAATHAATFHVPADFATIQAALDAATHGDEIVVATGTYHENLSIGGKNLTLRSSDPTDATVVEATILDGSHTDSVVIFSGAETANCLLAGFNIQDGSSATGYGGGIRGNGTHATLRRNWMHDNLGGGRRRDLRL